MAADTWLVVGLGNPGEKYAKNRHNVGQFVVDELAKRLGASFSRHNKANARTAEGRTAPGGPKLVLAKSNGYMNTSGGPVSQLVDYYGIDVDHVVVVHDELDLLPGQAKLKLGGSAAGHNGLKDIHGMLGSPDFWRLRLGIGHPGIKAEVVNYVLKKPAPDQRKAIEISIDKTLDAVDLMLAGAMDRALAQVHAQPPRPKPPKALKPPKTPPAAAADEGGPTP